MISKSGLQWLNCALMVFLLLMGDAMAVPAWVEKEDAIDTQSGLYRFEGCKLIPTEWGDGDSFLVETPGGKQFTVRLYGMDCFESVIRDSTDARRLRSQRRWFGIVKDTPQESMQLAQELGKKAGLRVGELLEKPFTVVTAFADARGDARFERFYGYVADARGKDLGSTLVQEGWARAFGVVRSTWEGMSRDDYADFLRDLELTAASRARGAWQHTEWDALPEERRLERAEEAELSMSAPLLDRSVNPNTASRDELQSLPGVGEAIANHIIEAREKEPFQSLQDLQRVHGISEKKSENIEPFLTFD